MTQNSAHEVTETYNKLAMKRFAKQLVNAGYPNQWVLFKIVKDGDKHKKIPHVIRNNKAVYRNGEHKLYTYEQVIKLYRKHSKTFDGIGVDFKPEMGFGYIDYDSCFDADGSELSWATEVLDTMESFTERSWSGNGLHTIVSGVPASCDTKRNKKEGKHTEIAYVNNGFLAMTGIIYDQLHTVEAKGAEFNAEVEKLLDARKASTGATGSGMGKAKVTPPPKLVDAYKKFAAAHPKCCEKFYNKDFVKLLDVTDRSSFAMELLNHLAWACGRHEESVLKIYMKSKFEDRFGWARDQLHAVKISIKNACEQQPNAIDWSSTGRAWDEPAIGKVKFPHEQYRGQGDERYVSGLTQSLENFKKLLKVYGIKPKFNQITKEYECDPVGKFPQENNAIVQVESLAALNNMSLAKIDHKMHAEALHNTYNPVLDYIEKLEYKGAGHIQKLIDCITVPEDMVKHRDAIFKRFFIAAVAAADGGKRTSNVEAEPKYEYIVVMHGLQGKFKTRFINQLAPPKLREYVKDGLSLEPEKVDSIMKATMNWIVELGELDTTFTRAAFGALKAFMSEKFDVYRRPYGRGAEKHPRSTVFIATVNVMKFLRDATGNRRYPSITVENIVLPDAIGLDIDAVWAEAWHLYLSGEQWWETSTEGVEAKRIRDSYFEDIPENGLIDDFNEFYPDLSDDAKLERGTVRKKPREILFDLDYLANNENYTILRNHLERMNLNKKGQPDFVTHSKTKNWRLPKPLDITERGEQVEAAKADEEEGLL